MQIAGLIEKKWTNINLLLYDNMWTHDSTHLFSFEENDPHLNILTEPKVRA